MLKPVTVTYTCQQEGGDKMLVTPGYGPKVKVQLKIRSDFANEVLLNRAQAQHLIEQLQAWVDSTKPILPLWK